MGNFKSKVIILLDNGHGVDTQGKMSPKLDESIQYYDEYVSDNRFREWKYTRVIAGDVQKILQAYGYDARLVVPEDKDISLSERVKRINNVCNEVGAGNVIMVSIHANALGNATQWMGGQGWECYTTKGKTNSDILAEYLYKRAEQNFTHMKIRKDLSDGDSDKESNFYIILNAKCPAVLTENFFYDNKADLNYMMSDRGHQAVVRTHVEGILDYIESLKR